MDGFAARARLWQEQRIARWEQRDELPPHKGAGPYIALVAAAACLGGFALFDEKGPDTFNWLAVIGMFVGPVVVCFGIKMTLLETEAQMVDDARRKRVERVMQQTPYGAPATPAAVPFSPYIQPRPTVRGLASAPAPVVRVAPRSSRLQWVEQEDDSGCVAACVAMMLGIRYRSAANLLLSEGLVEPAQLTSWGMSFEAVEPVLSAASWVRNDHSPDVLLVYVWGGVDARTGNPDLRHAVLALPDGTVLDPSTPEPRHIKGYHQVGDALGFKRLR